MIDHHVDSITTYRQGKVATIEYDFNGDSWIDRADGIVNLKEWCSSRSH